MVARHPEIPPLAGLDPDKAGRVGLTVEENVRRLMRYQWVARRLMEITWAHLASTPEWEIKCALALHQGWDAEHADAFRRRIGEMRHPVPRMDHAPDSALDAFLEELLRSEQTVELVIGIYGVARPALLHAYRDHLAAANPLVDHPTTRVLRMAALEEEDAIAWGERAIDALLGESLDARQRGEAWQGHLRNYLDAAGGIAGEGEVETSALPAPRAARPFTPDFRPRRDERFEGLHQFDFPPHQVYAAPDVSAEERNLALLCKRALEMDVPEMMVSFLWERRDRPWKFYRDYARQLSDEARHAMMGTVGLAARGIDWMRLPLNVGFSLRLNLHASALERQVVLWAIEQSLMPGETGKRYEYETAVEAGDPLSAHFHDYDWADEVLHAQIGRRWLGIEGVSPERAMELAREVHERTWSALERYREQGDGWAWWRAFVRQSLGRESAARFEELGELKILAE
jgi:hypothetical protein